MERKERTLLRAAARVIAALLVLAGTTLPTTSVQGDATPRGTAYRNFENWGGTWSDAEKNPLAPFDDHLCWAATAANLLDYTGWGRVGGMTNSDQMFSYYVNHWTNVGGIMDLAWEWWFTGVNASQGWSGWSQVDVPGGGFYPGRNFWNYYHEQLSTSLTMSAIDQFTHLVGLAVYGPGAHAITCWGYNYDPESPDTYYGIWVSDSDDDKYLTSPPDRLRYYDVAYSSSDSKWYIQNFYGSNSWYIGGVEAMDLIPEPTTILALIVGLAGLALRRRYHR